VPVDYLLGNITGLDVGFIHDDELRVVQLPAAAAEDASLLGLHRADLDIAEQRRSVPAGADAMLNSCGGQTLRSLLQQKFAIGIKTYRQPLGARPLNQFLRYSRLAAARRTRDANAAVAGPNGLNGLVQTSLLMWPE
jgi:hypothetical protein